MEVWNALHEIRYLIWSNVPYNQVMKFTETVKIQIQTYVEIPKFQHKSGYCGFIQNQFSAEHASWPAITLHHVVVSNLERMTVGLRAVAEKVTA